MKKILLGLLISLAAVSLRAAEQPVAILPVSEVQPGMKGVAYTVFEGTTPESFPVEVLGVLKNVWGPRQHIVLVRVGGRAENTGVASGMSGSPVYIDGKWLGAISLRLGWFPSEPLAGVTPAESMMEIQEADSTQPAAPVPLPAMEKEQANPPAAQVLAAFAPILPVPLRPIGSVNNGYLVPIETPLVFTGFPASVLEVFAPVFQKMGVVAVQGGAETVPGPMPSVEEAAAALPPGSAVSGMLVTGDLSLAGTGTVTYNDGRLIWAFGHPFFGVGPVEMPMSKAEIITTLGSSFAPFKIANSTQIVGSFVQDRHSGILGVLGKPARMIPVTTTMRSGGQSVTYQYQVFENPRWTPMILLLTFFSTIYQSNWVTSETSFKVRGSIQIEGFPPVLLDSMNVTPAGAQIPPGFTLATWLSQKFGRIFQNPFEPPEVTSVQLDIELIPEIRSATIENVWSGSSEVVPGEQLPVKILLRPYRGEAILKETTIQIPPNAAKGILRIMFSDADSVSQQREQLPAQQNRAGSLREIISLLNRERNNQQLYVTLLEATPSAFLEDKLLPSIPSTIANVMDSVKAADRLFVIPETTVGELSIPLDVVVAGNQSLTLTVK